MRTVDALRWALGCDGQARVMNSDGRAMESNYEILPSLQSGAEACLKKSVLWLGKLGANEREGLLVVTSLQYCIAVPLICFDRGVWMTVPGHHILAYCHAGAVLVAQSC
ncbi:unnamed protein product [Calypogeia fissa]